MIELNQSLESHNWCIKYALASPPHQTTTTLQTVVFVHGTPWSSSVFQPLARALLSQGRHRVLLYDLAGYGQSQTLRATANENQPADSLFPGSTSVATQAAILTDLLHHLRLDGREDGEAPAVIAHDIAGTIALRTHLIHHCNFASLLLLDTNTVLPWGDGFYKLVRSQPEPFLALPWGIFEAMMRAVIRSACFNPKVLDGGWEDILALPWLAESHDGDAGKGERSFVRQIAQADDADVREMLEGDMYGKVRCDVKIIWGEADRWIPREKMERLAEMLGDRCKGFVVVPEAGHLVMLDQPERVAVEVVEWLRR